MSTRIKKTLHQPRARWNCFRNVILEEKLFVFLRFVVIADVVVVVILIVVNVIIILVPHYRHLNVLDGMLDEESFRCQCPCSKMAKIISKYKRFSTMHFRDHLTYYKINTYRRNVFLFVNK